MGRISAAIRAWWNRHPLLQPLIVGGSVIVLQQTPSPSQVRFAELAPGERVTVRYTTDGCFNTIHLRIEFTGTASGVRYVARSLDDDSRGFTKSGVLTRAEAAKLDVSMGEARSPVPQGCTTSTSLVVTRSMFGIPFTRESLSRGDCSNGGDALTFRELIDRPR